MEKYTIEQQDGCIAAIKALQSGGVVLYPTDTIYGLGVDARNTEAVEKLLSLKQRVPEKGISVLVPFVDDIYRYIDILTNGEKIVEHFLPGPLTVIGKTKVDFSDVITGGTGNIAIRVPDNDVCRVLAEGVGGPLTATSANVSGEEPGTTIQDILDQFGARADEIDVAIDAGPVAGTTPSTVVDVSTEEMKILREGAISESALRRVI